VSKYQFPLQNKYVSEKFVDVKQRLNIKIILNFNLVILF